MRPIPSNNSMRLFFAVIVFCASAGAQSSINIKPGHINYMEGRVLLDGHPIQQNFNKAHHAAEGQLLTTGEGKAEVQFGLWTTLWMGESSSLRFDGLTHKNMRLRLEEGSIIIEIIEGYKNAILAVQVGDALTELKEIGLYRFDAETPRLRVYTGKAQVRMEEKKKTVKQGRAADFSPGLKTAKFDKKKNDLLHHWAVYRSHVLYDRIKEERLAERSRIQREKERFQQRIELEARQKAAEQLAREAAEQSIRMEMQKMQQERESHAPTQ